MQENLDQRFTQEQFSYAIGRFDVEKLLSTTTESIEGLDGNKLRSAVQSIREQILETLLVASMVTVDLSVEDVVLPVLAPLIKQPPISGNHFNQFIPIFVSQLVEELVRVDQKELGSAYEIRGITGNRIKLDVDAVLEFLVYRLKTRTNLNMPLGTTNWFEFIRVALGITLPEAKSLFKKLSDSVNAKGTKFTELLIRDFDLDEATIALHDIPMDTHGNYVTKKKQGKRQKLGHGGHTGGHIINR